MSAVQSMILPVTYEDLRKIPVVEPGPVEVVTLSEADGFLLNTRFTTDFRLRKTVCEKLKEAQKRLPAGYRFMIYEAYRPLKKQVAMWNETMAMLTKKYPASSKAEIAALTETFIANPHDGIGSGHQACCAVDITLCTADGEEIGMGTACQEFDLRSVTASPDISDEAKKNRQLLLTALEGVGFANYPAEWWHFSYGDHQWAFLAKQPVALYAPIDI